MTFKMEDQESPDSKFTNESQFYEKANEYWSQIPPTIDGMLGGFGCISNTDIRGSELFLKKIFNLKDHPGKKRALDCGAGIGRITKNLLIKYFDKVDLVEQNPKFVEAGKKFLMLERKVGDFFNCGLQNFILKSNYYDVIWCQWVLGHLIDEHLVKFLINCKSGLRKNGMIVIKENVCTEGIIPDEEDSSVTRSVEAFTELFKKADLDIVRHCKQANFPKQLFSVKLFALRPKSLFENFENVTSSDERLENATQPNENIQQEEVSYENEEKQEVLEGSCNKNPKIIVENIPEVSANCLWSGDIAEQLTGVIIKDDNES